MSVDYPLGQELTALEGVLGQNPETGASGGGSYLGEYTTRIFGAPYQLLDSVDRRLGSVNANIGNEYLRNFLLNSPILHVRPGMPKYTGQRDTGLGSGLANAAKNMYMDTTVGDMSAVESLVNSFATSTVFSAGGKFQKRMFGFRETYYDYMQHVNFMCRSMATFMNLTGGGSFPNYTYGSTGQLNFSDADWSQYRMMSSSVSKTPLEILGQYADAGLEAVTSTLGQVISAPVRVVGGAAKVIGAVGDAANNFLNPDNSLDTSIFDNISNKADEFVQNMTSYDTQHISQVMANKISSVEFMVEPVQFTETLTNQTKTSTIESMIESLSNGLGSEIAFITGSNADLGAIEGIMSFLGDTTESAAQMISGLTQGVTGGFVQNIFSGALQSIKGQKMIYPEIYEKSNSTTDYEFTVTLTTPYGDIYNYYMNIVVPLMHLIALAAPRMVTSNTTTSPFLVQAYIPGMCTVNLGIISSMTITKNPTTKHVSVNGFPLTVKVTFTVKELYNALSISPANNPASFMFNDTLNDYMANLAGLIPSTDTFEAQRKNAFENMNAYLTDGQWANDAAQTFVEKIENTVNPFSGR
ncbi:MAG: hypothetical protein NC489_11525 [Ruminococcus flavefaciens]|nr:hypothetical protein [Ruminococcus flavefaciens]